ncbi:MAG: inosine/xanthosine triphosphatase [Woeseiaceae bacterium]
MRVVVASHNPVKVAAVRQAFAAHFDTGKFEFESVSVESGVGDQPQDDAETRRGARNRVNAAATSCPDADFCVGLEGGIETIDDHLMAFAWMAIRARTGRISEARTVTLPLPDAVRDLVREGMELGDANDRVFATSNSKQQGGAFGLLTNGRYTREGVYAQALTIALVPFVHELYS